MASSSLPRGVVWGASNSPPLPPLVNGKFQDFRYPESRTHSNDRDSRSRQGISSARASTREPGIRRWPVPAINPIHRSRLERRDEFSSSPTTTPLEPSHFLGSSINARVAYKEWPIPTLDQSTGPRLESRDEIFSSTTTTPRSRKMGKLRSRDGW